MTQEGLYREIGNIDDDLIQAANEPHVQKHKPPMLYRVAGMAACFLLICVGVLFWLYGDAVYINETAAPTAFKVIVPADESITIVPMSYQDLLAYYGVEQLPDAFGGELTREEQSFFVLYQDHEGSIVYDANIFYYNSFDRSKTVSITLFKAEESTGISHEDMKRSKIDGVSLLLAASSNETGATAYWADFRLNGVSVRMITNGLSEDEFIDVVTEFIRILK